MYARLMVPLDGSPLAECVLPHLNIIASGCGAKEISLVRVVPPIPAPPVESGDAFLSGKQIQQIQESLRHTAGTYLAEVAERLKIPNVKVNSEVLEGPVADTLTNYANQSNPDLIIIATHGRGGISRWVYGSVADRILRSACVPVLMIRAPGCVPGI